MLANAIHLPNLATDQTSHFSHFIHFNSTFPHQPASLVAVIVCIIAVNTASLYHSTSIQTPTTARMTDSRELGVVKVRFDSRGLTSQSQGSLGHLEDVT